MLRRLMSLLFGIEATGEILDREPALEELRREREAAWAEMSLPTFTNAWGCVNCSIIQIRPDRMQCAYCGSYEIVNLALQLRRGATRIERRRAEMRRVTR